MIRKMWLRFCAFVCCICLIMPCFSDIAFAASDTLAFYGFAFNCYDCVEHKSFNKYIAVSGDGIGDFCAYLIPFMDDSESFFKYQLFIVSNKEFSYGSYYNSRTSMTESEVLGFVNQNLCTGSSSGRCFQANAFGWYAYGRIVVDFHALRDIRILGTCGNIPFIECTEPGVLPWNSPDFVLGEDPNGGGSSSSIVYDSSIPAPANLRFESKSVGGFLGIGSKFEHKLSWSNGAATPSLYARISAVASTQATEDDVPFEDSTVSLLSAVKEGGYQADIGKYSVGTDELASKILPGTSLNKVLEYRVQFYRYVDDVLQVGPVSTIHIKTNIFGKYDGYTVTTEYPKDPDNPGASGGTDDFYDNDWSSDGSHYDEYDKDGNLIDSGTTEDDGGPINKLLKSLKSIPQLIGSFFDSVNQLFAGIGNFPALLSRLFAFLPAEIIALVGLGISVVIVLRILGR